MKNPANNGSTWAITAIAIAVCIYAFYTHAIWALSSNTDAGWLIQTGQNILDHGLPKTNTFSWAIPHSPIVVYQWLFEIVVAWLFQFGSLWFVGLCACTVTGALIFYALPRLWMDKGLPAFLPFAVLALVQSPTWFHARPQIVSFCLILTFVCLLERYRTTRKAVWLLPLPPLVVLWANTHLLWTFGLLAVFIYLCCDAWRRRALPTALSVCLAACAAAVLINPYGIGLIAYVATFFNSNLIWNGVWEMLPSYTSWEGCFYYVGVLAACIVLALARRKLSAEALILSAIVTMAALFIRRFQPVAIITMWTFVGDAIVALGWLSKMSPAATSTDLQRGRRARSIMLRIGQAALVLFVPTISWYCHAPNLTTAWMLYTEDSFPLLAAYQKVSTPEDRLFNEDSIGSWLIGMQGTPVFIDTRFDNYPKPFIEPVVSCLKAESGWSEYLDRWQITQVLLRDLNPLNQALMYRPDWTLVLHDGKFAWWTRKTELSDAVLRHWSLSDALVSDSKLPDWIIKNTVESRAAKHLLLSRIYRQKHQPAAAIEEAEMGLKLLPQSSALQRELALCGSSM